MSSQKIYFKNLDSIRFFAAMMVFLQHGLSSAFQYLPIKGSVLENFLSIICNGELGVIIFFVLSGFLITYLLISEYEINNQTISLRNFYIRRVLRIWPLYYLIVLFTFIVYPIFKTLIGMNNPLGSNLFYHIFFLSNFDVIRTHAECFGREAMSQSITWSVSIEEQFYLFWPLIFTFLSRKLWFYAICIIIIGSIYFRIINSDAGNVVYFHTFSALLFLGVGGLSALIIKSIKPIEIFFENCSTKTHLFLLLLLVCFLFNRDVYSTLKYGSIIGKVGIAILFALIIVAQALTKHHSLLNFGNISFANKWGKYTYGIYMIHPIPITLLDAIFRILNISKSNFFVSLFFGIICFILTLFMSKISYDFYESKFLKLKSKFSTIISQ